MSNSKYSTWNFYKIIHVSYTEHNIVTSNQWNILSLESFTIGLTIVAKLDFEVLRTPVYFTLLNFCYCCYYFCIFFYMLNCCDIYVVF